MAVLLASWWVIRSALRLGYLLANPTISGALATFVNTAVGTILGTDGVVSALADAAGTLTAAKLSGGPLSVLPDVIAALKVNPAIDSGVNAGVTAAVAGLLGNTDVWTEVDSTVTAVVGTLLFEPDVQNALADWVAQKVELRATGPLGVFLGQQLGTLVVELLSNPTVSSGLLGVVDSMFSDFFGSMGVVSAFSVAAGTLAEAALTGNLPIKRPEVINALRDNTDVQAGVQLAVADAVYGFLGNSDLWSAIDTTLSAWVIDLTTNPVALDGLSEAVSREVQIRLGEPLGGVVGPQVGAAVAELVSNPIVASGLLGVVDTLSSDFFGSYGVVPAISSAAGEYALALVTGGDPAEARKAAQDELKASPAIDNGVDVSVTAAVAQFLGDRQLWAAVDQTVSSLAGALLTDPDVQQALVDQVTNAVGLRITGPLGVFVGHQLGTLVVELLTNPVVASGLLGVVDTLVSDFWTTPGVVDAFSKAAGALTVGALTGELGTVRPEVAAGLRANADVQAGVQLAVAESVGQFLDDRDLWAAVDGTVSAAVIALTTNPDVLAALGDAVSNQVTIALPEPLGGAVGPLVGAAVVSLISNPTVASGLLGVVDTLFADFLGSYGVVPAFSAAAGEFALALVTGESVSDATKAAQQELKASPAVDAGIDASVTLAVAQLLGDKPFWAAVDSSVSGLAVSLLGDEAVQEALQSAVSAAASKKLGLFLGAQVGTLVVEVLTNPVVYTGLLGLVDSVTSDFWGSPGVVTEFADTAGALALAWLTGDSEASAQALADLRANTDVQDAARTAFGDAVAGLLSDKAVWQAVDGSLSAAVISLTTNPRVLEVIGAEVSGAVSQQLGEPLGPVVGPPVGDAVVQLLSDPFVASGLLGVVDTLFSDFFDSYGVVPAFANAATELGLVLVTGGDWKEATKAAQEELKASPAVDSGVNASVGAAVTELFGDQQLWSAVGDTVGGLVTSLVGETAVQQYAGQKVAAVVTAALIKNAASIAAPVGQAVGTAVQQLLAIPGMASALGAVIGSVAPDFFAQDGVAAALGAAAAALTESWLVGDPDTVRQEILHGLKTDPEIVSALKVTIADVLTQVNDTVLSQPAIDRALGAIVSTATTSIVGSPAVQSFIGGRLKGPLGDVVVALLAAPGVSAALGQAVGSSVTGLLLFPGFTTTITDAIGQYADAVLDGTDDALQITIAALQANPVFRGAVATVVPVSTDIFLNTPAVQTAVQGAAKTYVTDKLGIKNKFVDGVAGRVVGGTVDSLLTQPAALDLFNQVIADVLDGMPLKDVNAVVVHAIITEPDLQTAIGMSLGAGIGALFGHNIVGFAIGIATGVVLSITVSVVAGIYKIVSGGGPEVPVVSPPSATAAANDSPINRLDGSYATTAVAPEGFTLVDVLPGISADAQFTLGDFAVTGLSDAEQADFLDVTLSVDDGMLQDTADETAPVTVGFRFRLDSLFPTVEPASFGLTDRRTVRAVS